MAVDLPYSIMYGQLSKGNAVRASEVSVQLSTSIQ